MPSIDRDDESQERFRAHQ